LPSHLYKHVEISVRLSFNPLNVHLLSIKSLDWYHLE
jgi:hypothetical protein